ncbi:hypothetical protein J5N97_023679 [Dioscorea zingiberensis]|uniref:Uncharacterized protein n=1 Tax=Dioscorea zingiberensis TaxID=325984 RepID=A0A9D5C677_9LILI|nr:hypothetical protein J5N97_023679 [Dioscorea zingiberensis]
MDSLDINTRLPPRKRLLAGLRKENSDFVFLIPSSSIFDHLRSVVNSGNSSPEEIMEASKLAALAAAEAAAFAKATALEKAAAAVKARDVAKDALELLASISETEIHNKGCMSRMKSKKKHVPIKLLYKNKQSARRGETDEELAKRLHRAINSSPRISNNPHKKLEGLDKDGKLPGINEMVTQLPVDKLDEETIICSNAHFFQKEEESNCSMGKSVHGSKAVIPVSRKAKIKRKKLLLSQCDIKDQRPKQKLVSKVKVSTEQEIPYSEAKNLHFTDTKNSNGVKVSTKISSMWKCKKLKVSHCSSDGKILHSLCTNPTTKFMLLAGTW